MAKSPKSTAGGQVPKRSPKKVKPLNKGFFKRNSFQIGIFIIAILVFSNGIGNNYALDDEFYTAGGNKLTQSGIKGIPKIFTSRTFFSNDGSGYSYRPVALASFAIESQFFGEDPHVSHFFNIILYALTAVLIFSILRKWFKSKGDWFSFFICLLFVVHPLHTEVVDNIKCRDELLAMLFTFLSIHLIWKHMETRKIIFLIFYPLCFWAGMLSKLTAVPFYFLIPLAIWFFADEKELSWKNEKRNKWVTLIIYACFIAFLIISRKPMGVFITAAVAILIWFAKDKFWKIALYMAPLFLTVMVTVYFQHHNLEPETRTYLAFENPLGEGTGFGQLTATSFYVVGRYLFLHFIPYPLVYYYGSYYVPIISWANPVAIISLLVFMAIGFWTILELRKKSIIAFGLLFFLINIAAYSNFLRPAPGLMAERYTYAASLGFCIVVMTLIFRFMKVDPSAFRWKSAEFKKVRFAIICIALVFAVRSFWRTGDWESKETLYGNDMEYLHESVKANMLYGALISKGALEANFQSRIRDGKGGVRTDNAKQQEAMTKFIEARTYYKKAAELAPYYHTAWSNLGTQYYFTGDTKEALSYFRKAVSIKDDYAEGWFNVGMAYDKLEQHDSAVYAFNKSISSDSSYVNSYEHLSRITVQNEHNPEKALSILQMGARNNPVSEVPWNAMSIIYLQQKDSAHYIAALVRADELNPNNVQRVYNIAQYYQRKGDFVKYNIYMARAEEGRRKMQQEKKEKENK
ncbi:hypothetical protein BH09BAC5_BH09BAC5_01030 [soil metagenome]